MSINHVTISGNLTRDPETRTTAAGSVICSFSVAVNDRVNEGGEWRDRPNYIDCTAFSGRGEYLAKSLRKGSKVTISGKLRWSQWEAKDGTKRSKIEVIVEDFELMTVKEPAPAAAVPVYAEPVVAVYETEEIPF